VSQTLVPQSGQVVLTNVTVYHNDVSAPFAVQVSMGKRRQMATAENWQQLELLSDFPEQHTYELIRPVVLFGQPLTTRAEETNTPPPCRGLIQRAPQP
jgi:hypothetical protein